MIRKEQEAVFPLESVATLVTRFVPRLNRDPEAGVLTTVAPPQLSVAVTEKFTTASVRPTSAAWMIFAGHVIRGSSVSVTITLNVFVTEFPLASIARQVTTLVPLLNVDPEGGTQTTSNWPGQLSLAPESKFTTAVQVPGSVVRGRSPGKV